MVFIGNLLNEPIVPPQAMQGPISKKLFQTAKTIIPGGVNSPVRAFRNVDGEPFFVRRAKGSRG